MRTLYICRHAKSSWADPGMADHERPLNERGRHDAPMMAQRFADRKEPVDLLVSSTARRAKATALEYAHALGVPATRIQEEPRIYEASVKTLMQVIEGYPEKAGHVMMFGHNPGFTELVAHLTGIDIGNMPTSGVARIDFAVDDWRSVIRGSGTLAWLDYPKRG